MTLANASAQFDTPHAADAAIDRLAEDLAKPTPPHPDRIRIMPDKHGCICDADLAHALTWRRETDERGYGGPEYDYFAPQETDLLVFVPDTPEMNWCGLEVCTRVACYYEDRHLTGEATLYCTRMEQVRDGYLLDYEVTR